ncbi:MAG: hypothetical protein ACOX2E_03045 [Syntrophaceticus sp.]
MTSQCPVCNGLTELTENCPNCSSSMEDCGKISSYLDPYGPYEDMKESPTEGEATTGDDQCVHFLQCPSCDESICYTISLDQI